MINLLLYVSVKRLMPIETPNQPNYGLINHDSSEDDAEIETKPEPCVNNNDPYFNDRIPIPDTDNVGFPYFLLNALKYFLLPLCLKFSTHLVGGSYGHLLDQVS